MRTGTVAPPTHAIYKNHVRGKSCIFSGHYASLLAILCNWMLKLSIEWCSMENRYAFLKKQQQYFKSYCNPSSKSRESGLLGSSDDNFSFSSAVRACPRDSALNISWNMSLYIIQHSSVNKYHIFSVLTSSVRILGMSTSSPPSTIFVVELVWSILSSFFLSSFPAVWCALKGYQLRFN